MIQVRKSILITGGAGFIGSAFMRMYLPVHKDWQFINLDALTYAGDLSKLEDFNLSKNYSFIKGDIRDRKLLETVFEEYNIDMVINFAAESHVDNSINNALVFLDTNIIGTYNLLDVALKFWSNSEKMKEARFIQISTDEVYGSLSNNQNSSTESDNLLPNSPYSASKASSELICRSYYMTFGLPVIITRSSNNFGPYQNKEKLIPKIIFNALNNEPIPIYGDGNNIRDWIYVDDNCEAIMRVLQKGQIGEIYNIGGNNELSNNQIVDTILAKLEKPNELKTYVKDRLGHDNRYSLNSDKLHLLGWNPTVDFEDALGLTIQHYKSNM